MTKTDPNSHAAKIKQLLQNGETITKALGMFGYTLGKNAYLRGTSLYLKKGIFGNILVCTIPCT